MGVEGSNPFRSTIARFAFVSTSGGSSGLRWLRRPAAGIPISRFSTGTAAKSSETMKGLQLPYALRDTADALRHVGEGHAQGQTVIQV